MWNIITAICIAFVVCAPVWALARYLQISLPKFLLPMLAGATLLTYNAYMRYTWSDRTVEGFPKEVVLLKEYRSSVIFEPWTYLFPRISHFIAADTTQTRTNPDMPDLIMGSAIMMQEHQSTINMTVLVNCGKSLVSLVPTTNIPEGKTLLDVAEWSGAEQFPYLVEFYCKE